MEVEALYTVQNTILIELNRRCEVVYGIDPLIRLFRCRPRQQLEAGLALAESQSVEVLKLRLLFR